MAVVNGSEVDNSWNLTIFVPDLEVEKIICVHGNEHIGAVILKLVNALGVYLDWSDHAIWAPGLNIWLTKTRHTLAAYNVHSGTKLEFTTMHKPLRVQLPDLQVYDLIADFTLDVFTCVAYICKDLGIRHPEELSFMRKMPKDELKSEIKRKHRSGESTGTHTLPYLDTSLEMDTSINTNSLVYQRNFSPMGSLTKSTMYSTLPRPRSLWSSSPNSLYSFSFDVFDTNLINSPQLPAKAGRQMLHHPRNFVEKAQLNFLWLDSSRTLMDQGIRENDAVLLRFKYFSIYDLNVKYDAVRINQLYEQFKWSLIAEEINCKESEMFVFAAIQVQIMKQSSVTQSTTDGKRNNLDEIDAALTELQECLEGHSSSKNNDRTSLPELSTHLRYLKPRKYLPKLYRRYRASLKDNIVCLYKQSENEEEEYYASFDISGCEATPDLNIWTSHFLIKLLVSSSGRSMEELHLKFNNEEDYIDWMAACKVAAKGKTMADSSYETEKQSIREFIQLQHPVGEISRSFNHDDIIPENFLAPRYLKKGRQKQYIQKILEAHAKVESMNLVDAKQAFIKSFKALPEFGVSYFLIRMKDGKRDELLGIAPDRIMRMEVSSGIATKTWRYSSLKSWHVNWDLKLINLDFEDDKVSFTSLTADCKVIHEYIGGYIFLSMRSLNKSQSLSRDLFFQLTCGWI